MSSITIKLQGLLSSLNRSSWQVCTLGNMTNVRFLWIHHVVPWWDFFLFFFSFKFADYSHGFSTFQTCKAFSSSTSWSKQLILGTTKASRSFNKCYLNRFDMKKPSTPRSAWSHPFLNDPENWKSLPLLSEAELLLVRHSLEACGVYTHPCTLASNELVILSLDTRSAAHIIILLLEVWVILELFRGLERDTQERKPQRGDDKLKKDTDKVLCTVSSYFIDYLPKKWCSVLLWNELVCPSSQELKLNCLKN